MSPANRTSDEYRQRDQALERLAASYGIGINEAASRVLFGGKPCGHIIRRLADEGAIELRSRAFEGGVSYFQPTERTCIRLGFPKDRASPLSGQALDKALAVLVWCVLSDDRRYRLERSQVKELLGDATILPGPVHCVGEEDGIARIYRMQLVQGGSREVIQSVHRELSKAGGSLKVAIETRRYGFALLVDSEAKAKSLSAAVERSGIHDECLVRVGLSATPKTLAQYLRAFRRS